ncbi:MAG: hypothetical protein JJE21_11160, partial [Spirochaetaceae bacterium]|nr:hypothetical protein [Spirochaetaceae bacterium]
ADFLYKTLGLTSTLSELGIKKEDFPHMAKKACEGGVLNGFKPLTQTDIENIFEMCM